MRVHEILLALSLVAAALLSACASCRECCSGAAQPSPVALALDFESATLDIPPPGFSEEVGTWRVVLTETGGRALGQLAENERPVFNVALASEPLLRDLELSVRMRAVQGEIDQGGGLVWRAKDARNYYICRYNPLEENFRLYKVIEGERTQLASAKAEEREGWPEIRVLCIGERMQCWYAGELLLEATDSTLTEPGHVGLWTKADAITWFDDLCAEPR